VPYGGDVFRLTLTMEELSDGVFHFKMVDAAQTRYEVPIAMPATKLLPPPSSGSTLYSYSYTADPFSLVVTRKATGQAVFNSTAFGGLVYSDQYLQLSTRLASSNVYGLGEHVAPFLLDTDFSTIPMFSRDQGTPTGYYNLYGVHPFLLSMEPSGSASGLFLLNSNAIDAVLQPSPGLTFRTIGGVLDFYVFLGPTVDNVVQQYTAVVGRPYFPPYWALGFHLCRWGYGSAASTSAVVKAMREAGIPQDVQWNDIDYMDNTRDFTLGETFQSLPDVVDDLHANGQHYIMIVDPAISNSLPAGAYLPYDKGMQEDVFIHNADGSVLVGEVWPGKTVFPDFFNPVAKSWWLNQVQAFHNIVDFDGLWIDMNEPSNFGSGSVDGCPHTKWDFPPYVPHITDNLLMSKTICMSAIQYGNNTHYNVHFLYGYSEVVATMDALTAICK
jgi:lysosomal alpha-glucosidase